MRSNLDPLYDIFEQHLYNALVEEETTEEFLDRVVADYMGALSQRGVIPHQIRASMEVDVRDEVLEMLRKKTYGHYNLNEFRKAKLHAKAAEGHSSASSRSNEKARSRRARRAS